jgi:hypothetical protein
LPFLTINGTKMEVQRPNNQPANNPVYDVVTATVVAVADRVPVVTAMAREKFSELGMWAKAKASAAVVKIKEYVSPPTITDLEEDDGIVQILKSDAVRGS